MSELDVLVHLGLLLHGGVDGLRLTLLGPVEPLARECRRRVHEHDLTQVGENPVTDLVRVLEVVEVDEVVDLVVFDEVRELHTAHDLGIVLVGSEAGVFLHQALHALVGSFRVREQQDQALFLVHEPDETGVGALDTHRLALLVLLHSGVGDDLRTSDVHPNSEELVTDFDAEERLVGPAVGLTEHADAQDVGALGLVGAVVLVDAVLEQIRDVSFHLYPLVDQITDWRIAGNVPTIPPPVP